MKQFVKTEKREYVSPLINDNRKKKKVGRMKEKTDAYLLIFW